MRLIAKKLAVPVIVGVITGTVLIATGGSSRSGGPLIGPLPSVAASAVSLPDGSSAKFAVLSRRTSNSCGLLPQAIVSLPDHMSLQGACCSAMDLRAYRAQVAGLCRYVAIGEIPRDRGCAAATLALERIRGTEQAPDRHAQLEGGAAGSSDNDARWLRRPSGLK